MLSPKTFTTPRMVGRYALFGEIARGGMATVHVGRLVGPGGFSRTVAIKRLHPNFAKDPEFVTMLMDEARLAARLHHPNVVSIIDVVAMRGELLLVMDYIPGDSLSTLLSAEIKSGRLVDVPVVVKILCDVLSGLHSAHQVKSERGMPLKIVHRDVSPQNVLVGIDGAAHLIDFGVAKATGRMQATRDGQLKGKIAYMAPEQLRNQDVDCRTDVYSASVVLWESLAGRRLLLGEEASVMYAVLESEFQPPSTFNKAVSPAMDTVVMKGLNRDPSQRFQTALEMGEMLEQTVTPASSMQVARWVATVATAKLRDRARLVAEVESASEVHPSRSEQLERAGLLSPARGDNSSPADLETTVNSKTPDENLALINFSAPDGAESESCSPISSARIQPQLRRRRWLLFSGIIGGVVVLVGFGAFLNTKRQPQAWALPTSSAAGTIPAAISSPPPAATVSALPSTSGPAPMNGGVLAIIDVAAADASVDSGKTVTGKPQPDKAKAQEKYGF